MPRHYKNVSCPACGHILGKGSNIHEDTVKIDKSHPHILIKDAIISHSGDVMSSDFHGSKCDSCSLNRRAPRKRDI